MASWVRSLPAVSWRAGLPSSNPACVVFVRGFLTSLRLQKAESFMERAAGAPTFAGGAFDFISVCPPYLLVSYPQLFRLLEVRNLRYLHFFQGASI